MRTVVPRKESKYPFASFCNLIEAASIVRYRLESISHRLGSMCALPTSPQPRSLYRSSSQHDPSSSSPGSLPYWHSSWSLKPVSNCAHSDSPWKAAETKRTGPRHDGDDSLSQATTATALETGGMEVRCLKKRYCNMVLSWSWKLAEAASLWLLIVAELCPSIRSSK